MLFRSRNATRVFLLLFDDAEDSKPSQVIELDPNHYRTGDIWHVFVKDACLGQIYAFKVEGPHEPGQGHLFCPNAILLDPYATAVASPQPWNFSRCCDLEHALADQSAAGMAKSLVIHNGFDWEDDRRLKRQWPELVIYETHVKGFTIHPSAAGSNPGTFLGFIEKIPYLQELGVNAVELMPLQEFNPQELTAKNPFTKEPLVNYWGYNTVGFFAPHEGYGTRRYPGCQVDEFKTLVKALHKAGIEVLLDVVFNHTAEGN